MNHRISRVRPVLAACAAALRRTRSIVGVALLATVGCEIADFEIERDGTATIRRGDAGGDVDMLRLDDEYVLADIEDEYDVGPDDLADAEITRFSLETLGPDRTSLDFVDRIEVFAVAPDLEPLRIAHVDDVPPGATSVEFAIDDVDLLDYVAAPHVTFVARIDGVAPPVDVRVQASVELRIGVTLRGACNQM
jgi:hypothetical protein